MQPRFNDLPGNNEPELVCPSCGGLNLHQDRIEVFDRDEDAKASVHVIVEDIKATVDCELARNPSRRRTALTIQFTCEGCSSKPLMTVLQHKGCTYVTFVEE